MAIVMAALLIAIVLFALFRPQYLNTDTAQYVVTARHLLSGDGLVTSLIYFEQQMVDGVMPAPQTVWPPGMPVLIAVLMAVGVPFTHAPFIVAMLSHVLGSLVLYAILRRLQCSVAISAGGALVMLTAVLANVLVLRGLSESTYVLCTLLGAWALSAADSDRSRDVWVLTGLAAAAAFLFRYAGITFVAALGIVVAARWIVERTARTWWDMVAAMVTPTAVIATLSLRNWILVGSFTGGPSVEYGSSLRQVLQSVFWSARQVMGSFDDGAGWLLFVVLAGLIGWLVVEFAAKWRGRAMLVDGNCAAVLYLSFAYLIISVAMFSYLGYKRVPEMISARYLLPLLPFVVILVCFGVELLRRQVQADARARLRIAVIASAVLAVFLATQIYAVSFWVDWLRGDRKFAVMIRAMNESQGG